MKANQLREFAEPCVAACVLLVGGKDYLEIGENGILAMPEGAVPKGFHLMVAIARRHRAIVVQKNVGKEFGGYHRHALSQLKNFAPGYDATVMRDPIEVCRAGTSVWTSWHQDNPNRVDVWFVAKDSEVTLFQVGVFTHNNGVTWKLHGEYRWRGRFFMDGGRIVGKPEHPKWGKFDVRRTILDHPDFMELIKIAKISRWRGKPEELDPPLGPVPGPGYARMQWYITFAGQTGQGPANLHSGGNAWVHGTDIVDVEPDPDGEVRLWQGDLVSYEGTAKFGNKPNGPPKLLGVRLVERPE